VILSGYKVGAGPSIAAIAGWPCIDLLQSAQAATFRRLPLNHAHKTVAAL
jgi:hypothetical protein